VFDLLSEFVSAAPPQSGCLRTEYSLKPQWKASKDPLILALNQLLSALQIAALPQHLIGQFQLATVRRDEAAPECYTKYYSEGFNDQNMLQPCHATAMLFAHGRHLLKKAIKKSRVCVFACRLRLNSAPAS